MNFLKHIQILSLVLFPACLTGMEQGSWVEQDKHGENISIEWHKVTDCKTLLELEEQLMPVSAEAFADEAIDLRNFLLDDKFQIKKEFIEIAEGLSHGDREELDAKIAISNTDRMSRVGYLRQMFLQKFEKTKAVLLIHSKHVLNSIYFVVTAKDKAGEVLGLAIFNINSDDCSDVWVDQLAVLPKAQGRGLARLLMFSILKLNPEIACIGLNTELWNVKAREMYTQAFKFTERRIKDFTVWFEHFVK